METAPTAEAILRDNIKALMRVRQMKQGDLAGQLGLSQAWVSKRLSAAPPPKGSRFQVGDLDALARVFNVAPSVLLLPSGNWDRRRSGHDRRSGRDRRMYPQ